jgi:hypothetical protein
MDSIDPVVLPERKTMFLIMNLIDGETRHPVGVIRQRETWDEAVDCCVKMAAEQCATPEDEIRKEVECEGSFVHGGITVQIATIEDD